MMTMGFETKSKKKETEQRGTGIFTDLCDELCDRHRTEVVVLNLLPKHLLDQFL